MRFMTKLTGLLVLALLSTGCIVVGGGGGGELTVFYLFGGAECGPAGVNRMVVTVVGVNTSDSDIQDRACASEFSQGITIKELSAGEYDVTVQGFGAGTEPLYAADPVRVTVLRNQRVEIDIDAIALAGDLTVFYLFGGAECGPAGVDRMVITVVGVNTSDSAVMDVACASNFSQGITIKELSAGQYDVTVQGFGVGTEPLYAADPVRVTVLQNQTVEIDVDASARAGDLTAYWSTAGAAFDCAGNAVVEVSATLSDVAGNVLNSDTFACTSAGVTWQLLTPGVYTVNFVGLAADGTPLFAGGAQLTVVAGAANDYTVDLDSGSLTIFWTFAGSGACGAVVDVRVTLTDPFGTVYDDSLYDCTFGGLTYGIVPPGVWTVDMSAIDGTGRIIYSTANRTMEVFGGTSNEYTLDLL